MEKYIFNFCVLVSTQEKYLNRLYEFVHFYGYRSKNFKNKIKITFLADSDDKPCFVGEDIEWINIAHDKEGVHLPLSMRFLYYLKNYWTPACWTMQVDDDSSTDIDKTIEILNQFYDSEDGLIFTTGRCTDIERPLQEVIREMNIPNFTFENNNISRYSDNIPYIIHSWESCILSEKGVKNIINYSEYDKFWSLCRQYRPGFSDQTIFVIAKFSKVAIVESSFLCSHDRYHEFSLINPNGRYTHIHYVIDVFPSYSQIVNGILSRD
jgi:hypothetical protein